MRKVYAHRYEDIENKKNKKIGEKHLKLREKEDLSSKKKKWEKEDDLKFLKEMGKIKKNHKELLEQIEEKWNMKREELSKDLEEERERKLRELEYNRKIQEEIKKGDLLLQRVKELRDNIY